MRRIILASLVISAALAGGCTGSGTAYYAGGGTLTATTVAPDLVYVNSDVQVVADYEYPVFYADNFYWRFDSGRWYRSSWYTGGWAYATPPYSVLRIERPYAYRHYRPSGYVSRRGGVYDRRYERPVYRDTRPVYRDTRPVYRDRSPVVRDHREQRAPVYRAPAAGPTVRDHRERREYRAPTPAPAPATRDHRASRSEPRAQPTTRDHRDGGREPRSRDRR